MKGLPYSTIWLALILALVGGCSCGDDDDDDSGGGGDDDDDDSDDAADDDLDDDADDDSDDDAAECVDEDGDTYGENCAAGSDCNDGDANAWQILTGYMDVDGDGYAGTAVDVCAGESLPPGEYYPSSDDCDDADALVHPGATDLPDDGVDQDCADGDVTASDDNGYFVDVDNGSDSNPGTKAEPFETIQKGNDEAETDADRPNVYITGGSYEETLTVSMSLFGGYNEDWTRDIDGNPTELEAVGGAPNVMVEAGASVVFDGLTINGNTTSSPIGILTMGVASVVARRLTIDIPDNTGTRYGIYATSATYLDIADSEISVGEGTAGDDAFGIFVSTGAIVARDMTVRVADTTGAAMGIFGGLLQIDLNGVEVDVDSTGNVYGVYSNTAPVRIVDSNVTIAEGTDTRFGIYTSTSPMYLRDSVVNVGDSSASITAAIYAMDGDLTMIGVQAFSGDAAAGATWGVYAPGSPFKPVRVVNSIIQSGSAGGDTYGIFAPARPIALVGNTILAYDGNVASAVFAPWAGTESAPRHIVNNILGIGSGTTIEAVVYQVGAPMLDLSAFHNNAFYADGGGCYVQDAVDCWDDIDDINDCEVDSCLSAGGNIDDEPAFVDPGDRDFHLDAGAAMIDAGTNPAPYLPTDLAAFALWDLDGDARPNGAAWDIGADEVVAP